MGLFGKLLSSDNKGITDVSQADVERILNVFSLICENADDLNCLTVSIGPYWTEYNGIVMYGSGAIAVGISDYEEYRINQELSQRLGLDLSVLNGKTYAQKRIGNGEMYSKRKKLATIEAVYNELLRQCPDGFTHKYDPKEGTILIAL